MPTPSITYEAMISRLEFRVQELEKSLTTLRINVLQMQRKPSYTSGDTEETALSSASEPLMKPSRSKMRRIRRQRLMSLRKLIDQGLMPEGTTTRDLPPGFGTKSPTPSVLKFCELGLNKVQLTKSISSLNVAREPSGSSNASSSHQQNQPNQQPVEIPPDQLVLGPGDPIETVERREIGHALVQRLQRALGGHAGHVQRETREWRCWRNHAQMVCKCPEQDYRVRLKTDSPTIEAGQPPPTPAGSMDTYPMVEDSDEASSWETISDSGSEKSRAYYPVKEEWVRRKAISPPWSSGRAEKAPEPPVWLTRTFKSTVYDYFNQNRERLLDNISEDHRTKLVNCIMPTTWSPLSLCTCVAGLAKFCEKHWAIVTLRRVEVVDDEENEEQMRRNMYEEYSAYTEFEPPQLVDEKKPNTEVEEDPVSKRWSLGAWVHNKFFKDREIDLDEALRRAAVYNNGSLYVHSELDSGMRWRVVKNKQTGEVHCVLQEIPAVNNNVPGLSNLGVAFAEDETRTRKVLILSGFMKKRGLPFVDLELYYHLKTNNLNTGTAKSTHAKLSAKADVFLAQFRISQYDPQLLLEVKLWTVLAAMLPTKSEILALQLLGKNKVFGDINKVADFKRDGVVRERRLWGLLPDRVHTLQHD